MSLIVSKLSLQKMLTTILKRWLFKFCFVEPSWNSCRYKCAWQPNENDFFQPAMYIYRFISLSSSFLVVNGEITRETAGRWAAATREHSSSQSLLHCNITLNSAHVPPAENSINSFLRNEYVPLIVASQYRYIQQARSTKTTATHIRSTACAIVQTS